jgi:hypothetical protein
MRPQSIKQTKRWIETATTLPASHKRRQAFPCELLGVLSQINHYGALSI